MFEIQCLIFTVSNFDEKASDNPDIPLGDNGSMNNTSDINDCISIDSDYEGVASLSNSMIPPERFFVIFFLFFMTNL
jgi:hypothetical protein